MVEDEGGAEAVDVDGGAGAVEVGGGAAVVVALEEQALNNGNDTNESKSKKIPNNNKIRFI